jgi:ribosome modulation factor
MDDDEPVLLHDADLMLALMRAARHAPATLDDALARLLATLAAAGEPVPPDPADLRRRFRRAASLLAGAGVLAPAGEGGLRLTEAGVRLLAEHPDGIDESVLETLPAFRAYLAETVRRRTGYDPHEPAFEAGFRAYAEGKPLDANPFDPDGPRHLGWENGWCEARDRRRPDEC